MVDVYNKRCAFVGCLKQPAFGFAGTSAEFCAAHVSDFMTDVKSVRCKHDGCLKRPCYGIVGSKAEYCFDHALPKMVNVKALQCTFLGCSVIPTFGKENGRPEFCKTHAPKHMRDITRRRCEHPECFVKAHFNVAGGDAKFCRSHAPKGAVNVVSRVCEYVGCLKFPSFGTKGGRKQYCAAHASSTMVDVVSTRCQFLGCDVRPIFKASDGTGNFCKAHAPPDMIGFRSVRCEFLGCMKAPSFGTKGEQAKFCKSHASADLVDVSHIHCACCPVRAHYNLPGNREAFCAKHKPPGAILNPRRICKTARCRQAATHGVNRKMTHCEDHAVEGEMDYVQRTCASCGLIGLLNADKRCCYCDPAQSQRIRLAKQNRIQNVLEAHTYPIVSVDRMIERGVCVKYRPDFLMDALTHFVVLEVDENQHSGYPCECESVRMFNIAQALALPTIFIRYNPDEFRIGSKKQDVKEADRWRRLHQVLQWALYDVVETPFVSARYLFYDNCKDQTFLIEPAEDGLARVGTEWQVPAILGCR